MIRLLWARQEKKEKKERMDGCKTKASGPGQVGPAGW